MNVWKRFVGFKLDDSMSTVGVSARLKEWWWEWSNMHVDILRDTFLAFVAQNGLPQGSRLKEEVDRQIEHLLLENDHQQISLTAVLHLIESCRQQLQHEGVTNTSIPTTFLAKTEGRLQDDFPEIVYPVEAYLDQIKEDLWDRAVILFAARAGKCLQCGSNDHIKQQCPERNRTVSSGTNRTYALTTPHATPHSPFNSNQIYPILGAVYPPVNAGTAQTFQNQHLQTPQVVTQPGLRQADYYRSKRGEGNNHSRVGPPPRSTGPASARMIELGSLPEDLSDLLFSSLGGTDDLPKEARTISQDQGR